MNRKFEYLDVLALAGIVFSIGMLWYSIKTNPTAYKPPKTEVLDKVDVTNSILASNQQTTDFVGKKVISNLTLTPDNSVVLRGPVDENAMFIAQEITAKTNNGKPVYLLINSPGGSIFDGIQIVNAIQSAKVPVVTICFSLCASMAAIIFEVGKQRLMVDRSILMFHEAAGGVQGPFNQLKSRFHVIDRLVNKLDYEIATRVGINVETFRAQLGNELWLDSEDAVNQHYADGLTNAYLKFSTDTSSPEERKRLKSATEFLKDKVNVQLMN